VRVVFDTNVLLAAFLTEGLCAKLLIRARKREFEMFLCPVIFSELERILKKKFKANPQEITETLAIINEAAQQTVTPDRTVEGICRDKDDDHILACAAAIKAEYLVTGDADLLTLKIFEGIRILSPRDFEAMMEV